MSSFLRLASSSAWIFDLLKESMKLPFLHIQGKRQPLLLRRRSGAAKYI